MLAIVVGVSSSISATSHEPSPEELAAEVKPLMLEQWKKDPILGKATIQSIALVHKGGGIYSGFVEVKLDGQSERFSLEVVLDRETIRWQIKPEANQDQSRPKQSQQM